MPIQLRFKQVHEILTTVICGRVEYDGEEDWLEITLNRSELRLALRNFPGAKEMRRLFHVFKIPIDTELVISCSMDCYEYDSVEDCYVYMFPYNIGTNVIEILTKAGCQFKLETSTKTPDLRSGNSDTTKIHTFTIEQ